MPKILDSLSCYLSNNMELQIPFIAKRVMFADTFVFISHANCKTLKVDFVLGNFHVDSCRAVMLECVN